MDEFVNVSVRIRPFLKEEPSTPSLQVINKNPAVLLVSDKPQMYHFDNIFTEDVEQIDVYNHTVKRLVDKVKLGYNCTVFAYGQTGTGKTYTIGTNPDVKNENEMGLISRTLEDFFTFDEEVQCEISISFIEIYNEKVFDLMDTANSKAPLPVKGFTVQGFNKQTVKTPFEAEQYLKSGSARRHIGGTKQNSKSSRSHAIFSIYCCTRNSEKETIAKLNLVDLAGSESVRKTGNRGSSFYEGVNINKGLLSLGQVMTALSTNSNYVPYRQSIVTTILQDSLNKKNFVSLIACVSSSFEDLTETLQTLEFSNRVKKLKSKPEVNEFMVQYKKDHSGLFANHLLTKGQTPMKRANGLVYETPFKRPKNMVPLEPVLSDNNSNFDISPLYSSSLSSIVSEPQQNFSPVIRKYMTAMESSIMSKLEDVIKNTLQRPKRVKSVKNKENFITPRLARSRYNDSVCSDVNNSFVTSSPSCNTVYKGGEEEKENLTPTPNLNNSLNREDEDNYVFKMPEPRTKDSGDKKRRASTRLQLKKQPNLESSNTRRSVRLQLKSNQSIIADPDTSIIPSVRGRKSVRLQLKAEKPKNISPPTNNCTTCEKTKKKLKACPKTKDSPITKRTKHVLQILNGGTLREIQTLQTVGTKTAEKLLLFRQMEGGFSSISDIAKMPYWGTKKYEKFLAENFIRDQ